MCPGYLIKLWTTLKLKIKPLLLCPSQSQHLETLWNPGFLHLWSMVDLRNTISWTPWVLLAQAMLTLCSPLNLSLLADLIHTIRYTVTKLLKTTLLTFRSKNQWYKPPVYRAALQYQILMDIRSTILWDLEIHRLRFWLRIHKCQQVCQGLAIPLQLTHQATILLWDMLQEIISIT